MVAIFGGAVIALSLQSMDHYRTPHTRHFAEALAASRVANQFARQSFDGVLAAVEAVAAAEDGAERARAELCE